jgi:hypothetical protein
LSLHPQYLVRSIIKTSLPDHLPKPFDIVVNHCLHHLVVSSHDKLSQVVLLKTIMFMAPILGITCPSFNTVITASSVHLIPDLARHVNTRFSILRFLMAEEALDAD